MAARISWNWCRASWGVSSRYEARHHRADRADLEGRTRGRGHRDPARSVWGMVVGPGFEGGTRREYAGDWGLGARACDRLASRRDIHSSSRLRDAVPQSPSPSPEPPVPRDQVADGWDLLPIACAAGP